MLLARTDPDRALGHRGLSIFVVPKERTDGHGFVLTESGGLQEETTALGVPCLRLPREHGAPITIFQGTNLLVGTDPGKIVAARDTLAGLGKVGRIPPLWDGHTARRIVDILLKEVPRGHAS